MNSPQRNPTAVILSTYGEPTRNSFVEQWMYSYRILRRLTQKVAKIPKPVLPIIATKRARDRVEMWRENDFVSELEPLTDETVEKLAATFEGRGTGPDSVLVARSYEFRRPFLREVLPELRDRGCSRFVVVPMYMGTGDFTHGVTQLAIEEAVRAHGWLKSADVEMCTLTDSPERLDRLADAGAEIVLAECRKRGIELPAHDWAVCLAAHGSVQTPQEGVDNGVVPFGELCWRFYKRLKPFFGRARNGWLNHDKGGRWTEPAVPRLLDRLRAAGYEKLVYFPWGFTTDNAETALEGRMFCEEMSDPFERVEHLPCLNNAVPFIEFLADRIESHLRHE